MYVSVTGLNRYDIYYINKMEENMKELTVQELYTLEETIAKPLFDGVTYPWEVLPKISAFILELGATLSPEDYERRGRISGLPGLPK